MDTNNDIKDFNRLQELGGSDYEMKTGEPNIKGWVVTDSLGKVLGIVKELLFNPGSRLVRYIVLAHEGTTVKHDVLIPVGFAELHEKDDVVVVAAVTEDQVAMLPPYQGVHVSPLTESEIRRILNGMTGDDNRAIVDEGFYAHEHFNAERLYQRRKL
jgi:hypothetical protein